MRILWLALGAATIVALSVFAAWNTQSVDVYFQGIGTLRGVPLWLVVIAGAAIGAIATLLLEMPGRVRGRSTTHAS